MSPQDFQTPPSPDVAAEDCRRASADRLTAAMNERDAMLSLFVPDPGEELDQAAVQMHEVFETVAEFIIDRTECTTDRGTAVAALLSALHFAKRATPHARATVAA